MLDAASSSIGPGGRAFTRFVTGCALTVLLLGGGFDASASGGNPTLLIQQTTQRLLTAVEQERAAIKADPTIAHALVRDIVAPHFDLNLTCRRVLGKHWRRANEDQRARMVEEFETLLIRVYATAVTEFAADEMSYAPGVLKPSRAAVHVKVSHGNRKPVLLEYRLHRAEKGWKTFDVIVDGISLVMVYRSSFSAEIRKRGLDGLIEHLAAKNRKRAKRRDL